MKFHVIAFLSFLMVLGGVVPGYSRAGHPMKLWYNQPASEWMQSTPLGNGRLGIMVYGGIEKETIALNEITMWSGQEDKFQERPVGKELLDEIRQLFFDGDYVEGNRIGSEFLGGVPHSFGSHVPVGDLTIEFENLTGNVKNYRRQLNLENAVNEVVFTEGGVQYKREYFCSNPDDVFVVRLSASKKGKLNCSLSLDLLRESLVTETNNSLEFAGKVSFPKQGPGGVSFMGKVGATVDGGNLTVTNGKINIKDATTAVIVLDIRTDYKEEQYTQNCISTVEKALAKKYDILKQSHIRDYAPLYDRVDLFLGKSNADNLPTDIRWQRVKDGGTDVGLDALLFQYARYLLIASSRENSPLPANLQGAWNDNLACNMGWTNDYHLDINTQQNYWLSNIGNLGECNKPLFDYIEDLSIAGQRTARLVYGARGWTAHTVANVWGYTAPGQGVNWGLFPTGSSWIASHLWTHYVYTLDKEFLAKDAYPILKGNALFLLDYMVVNPNNGYLMTGPSTSPENSFVYQGHHLSLSMMPSCDRQLAYEIFTYCIEASEILGIDADFRKILEDAVKKLPPIMIGKNGAIQEWFEDFEEAQPNHRHTSHLLALYPFSQITLDKTPELAAAAGKTMEYRLAAEGWEDVEWSRANMICNYARLKDAEKAYHSVQELERIFTRENLLTISPEGIAGAPYDIFIFDGNEAGGAGIAEMLIQCHEGYVDFLPALPQEWNTGNFKGLCVKGGGVVDLDWKNGKAIKARITATVENTFKVKIPENTKSVKFSKNGKSVRLSPDADGIVEITLNTNETFDLNFS